jgi:hypothetical protein
MSQLIPLKIAELAIERKEEEINELKKEIEGLKEAGLTLSLKIHKSNTYAEFYPQLGEFERLIKGE